MKTKIKTISPDQNIIEHESGLKAVFVEGGHCVGCIYYEPKACVQIDTSIGCVSAERNDKKTGNFKLLEP